MVLNHDMQSSPFEKEKIIHNRILGLLKTNPKGLTMSEIVRSTRVSRKAAEKHLQILILENEIYMKQFGVTKVYYPNNRVHHFDFEHLDYNNRTIWFDILENEYGRYLLIQKKRRVGDEWIHEHSITIPLEQCEQFLRALEKILHSQRMVKLLHR